MKKPLLLALTALMLSPSLAQARTAHEFEAPFQIAATQAQAVKKIKKIVAYWEEKMASDEVKENPYLLFKQYQGKSYRDLRHKTIYPFYKDLLHSPEYPPLLKHVHQIRTQLAQRGMPLGHWKMWRFDGLELSAQDKKIIKSTDQKISSFRDWSRKGRGYDERIVKKFNELKKRLNHPAINKGQLKTYKVTYFYPQVQGLEFLLKVKEQDYVGDRWREIRQRIKTRTPGSQVHLKQIKGLAHKSLKVLGQLKAKKVNLNQASYYFDKRDVLSESKTLAQIEAEMKKVLKMK